MVLKGSLAFMQHFKFVNWWIRGFVFWRHEQVNSHTLSFWYTLKLGYSYYQAVALHGLEWCRRRHTAADQTLIYGEMTIIVGVIILCSLLDNHGLISMPDIWIKSSQNYTEWLASSLSFSNFLLEPWTRNCFCWKEIWISYSVRSKL